MATPPPTALPLPLLLRLLLAAATAASAAATKIVACPPPTQNLSVVGLKGHIVGFSKVCASLETCCGEAQRLGATSFTYNFNASHTPRDPDCRLFGALAPKKTWDWNCTSCLSFVANQSTTAAVSPPLQRQPAHAAKAAAPLAAPLSTPPSTTPTLIRNAKSGRCLTFQGSVQSMGLQTCADPRTARWMYEADLQVRVLFSTCIGTGV